VSSTEWIAKSSKLLNDEKLGSVLVRLMMVMNDVSITNSQMVEWDGTEDRKKKPRSRGAILYFGRVQSAHLYEALDIIQEMKSDAALVEWVERCDRRVKSYFETIAGFIGSDDHKMMAKMRNVVAFHYDPKLAMRRLKSLVAKYPDHRFAYSMGTETLDWYFELGDMIADDILIREVFEIDESQDIAEAAMEVLKRLHVIADAFTKFAPYFSRECCAR
jgi:hypothetical protein